MKYQVFENDIACSEIAKSLRDPAWQKDTFDNFADAVEFAEQWLGFYGLGHEKYYPNQKINYYPEDGCTIEVREI